jgi:hypothetical protein
MARLPCKDMDPPRNEQSQTARPPYVRSDVEIERWELCVAIAAHVMDAAPDSEDVWFAARAIYSSDLPT